MRIEAIETFSNRDVGVVRVRAEDGSVGWPGRTEDVVRAVRRALGNDVDLLVDAKSCYTPGYGDQGWDRTAQLARAGKPQHE
jgi:L-alanine-DL-glutamate epimerase-like enolase superfamily enzyme